MYKLETVIFTNGERFPLLINKETGLPDFLFHFMGYS